MRTRSARWPTAESLRGGTGVRVGRGGRGRRPREGNDERVDDLNGQGNDQGMGVNEGVEGINENVGNQGNIGNQNGNMVNENVHENVGNMIVSGNRIEKMESVHDMSGFSIDQKVKYTAGSFVGKALTWWNSQIHTLSRKVVDGHAAYTDRFHELARLVPHLVTPESRMIERYGLGPQIHRMVAAKNPKTIQKAVQISSALIDEAVRNGSIKKEERIRVFGLSVPPATPTMHPEGLIAHASTVIT
nr:putative reverse transcriptase domain-containing protein [Tanacetum cinerariifolium]